MNKDDIQQNLLYLELLKDLNKGDEDDAFIKEFKIKLNKLK